MQKLFFLIIITFILSACVSTSRFDYGINSIEQNSFLFISPKTQRYLSKKSISEKKLARNYLNHYFAPWQNPYLFYSANEIKQIENQVIKNYENNPGFGENKHPHTKQWIDKIAYNMNLNAYPNLKMRAITTRITNLRLLPTNIPSFTNWKDAGQGYPFDNFQVSLLRNNEPVFVLHTSKNGAWKLIITPNKTFGWVKSQDIAYVNSQFVKIWRRTPHIVTLEDQKPIFNRRFRVFFLSRIGEIFPLNKINRFNYNLLVAVQNHNSYAAIKIANLNKKYAAIFPLKLTQKSIALIINRLIGQPYGWGGLYGYRDCSATLKDLFAPFGIWLPRNSKDQSEIKPFISLKDLSNRAKISFINQNSMPFLTLIWMPGHIMLYIGAKHNKSYIFHAPWGLHTRKFLSHKQGRAVIGRSVIMPLDFGRQYINVSYTLLTHVQRLTYLI